MALTSNLEPVALTFRPGGSILGPLAVFSGDSEQSACSRDPIRSTVSLPPILSTPLTTQGCNSSCDTHTRTHSHSPVGLVVPASRPSSPGQNDQSEAPLVVDADLNIAQGSWPSFAYQARCG